MRKNSQSLSFFALLFLVNLWTTSALGMCGQELIKKWNLTAEEIVASFGVDLSDHSRILREGKNGWIDLSNDGEALAIFNAFNIAVHGVVGDSGVWTPEHFVVRPKANYRLETYRLSAPFIPEQSASDWKQSILPTLGKDSLWKGAANDFRESYPMQSAFDFAGIRQTFILTPRSVYMPYEYSQWLLRASVRMLTPRNPKRILVMGSGGGYDALGLAFAFPQAQIVGADLSEAAVLTARKNAFLHGLSKRVTFIQSNLFEEVSGRFDAILFVLPRPIERSEVVALLGESAAEIAFRTGYFGNNTRFDVDGKLLRSFLSGMKDHLTEEGAALIMNDSEFKRRFASDLNLQVMPMGVPEPWNKESRHEGSFQIFEIRP